MLKRYGKYANDIQQKLESRHMVLNMSVVSWAAEIFVEVPGKISKQDHQRVSETLIYTVSNKLIDQGQYQCSFQIS